MMKRQYHGTYHRMSPKHLQRYVAECEGRHNDRPLDTMSQMKRDGMGTRPEAPALPRPHQGQRPAVDGGLRRAMKQKKPGRPPALKMPEPIDASPEAVARAIMRAPPKPDSEVEVQPPRRGRLPPRETRAPLAETPHLNERPPRRVAFFVSLEGQKVSVRRNARCRRILTERLSRVRSKGTNPRRCGCSAKGTAAAAVAARTPAQGKSPLNPPRW